MREIKSPESYSSSKLKSWMPRVWIGVSVILLYLILLLLAIFSPSFHKYRWFIYLTGVGVIYLEKKSFPFARKIGNFRYGEAGEKEVLRILRENLSDDYVYIRDYIIPKTRIGDIDGLLVGPKGVITIEIKHYAGLFRISSGDFFKRLKGNHYWLYPKNPIRQALQEKNNLEEYLKEKGITVKIKPLVILVDGEIKKIVGKTEVSICKSSELAHYLSNLSTTPEWSPQLSDKIVTALNLSVK